MSLILYILEETVRPDNQQYLRPTLEALGGGDYNRGLGTLHDLFRQADVQHTGRIHALERAIQGLGSSGAGGGRP